MQITIDTNNLSELDINMLAFLAEQGEPTAEADAAPVETSESRPPAVVASAAAAKKAPKVNTTVLPEPEATVEAEAPAAEEPEEDLVGGTAPSMSDAIAAATELVSNGAAAKVKEALSQIGVKRVSELKDADIPTFLAALA